MKMRAKSNRLPAKLLIPTLGCLVALAAVLPVSAEADDPPTITPIEDQAVNINGSRTVKITISDTETPPASLLVTVTSSNQAVLPESNILLGGSGSDRDLIFTPVPPQLGTTQIRITVRDNADQTAATEFRVKITPSNLNAGVPLEPGGLGYIATVIETNPAEPPQINESIGRFQGPFEIYSAFDLGGLTEVDLTDIGNFYALSGVELLNNFVETQFKAVIGFEIDADTLTEPLKVVADTDLAHLSNKPVLTEPFAPTIGSSLSGEFRPPASYSDSLPVADQNPNPPVFHNSAFHFTREFAHGMAPTVNTPAIGLIYRDAVSNAIEAGDSVPPRSVEPPPNTGSTFTSFDPAGISINSNYVAFYGKGDLFSGIYARRLSDSELFAAVESFPFQQGDLGLIWGAFLAGERDLFFNASGGVYHADAEGATPAELVLANGTEFEPGKVFNSGNLLHLAGNYGVIAGLDGGFKSTIFRLNLTDFSLEQIVQQGDPAPGGGTFGIVQRPGVSDTMVVFEGFNDSLQFLGLFAYLIETKELKPVVRVGDTFAGREVRSVGFQPGALQSDVLGFTVFFTDNSSGAYVTTPVTTFTVPFQNISTRGGVGTEGDVLIGGFIITEQPAARRKGPQNTGAKQVLIRAIGPSLGAFGIEGPLADPVLELHGPGDMVVINNDWRETQEQEILDSGLAPGDDLEAAIITTLEPGAYTAIVRGNNGGTGVGLVEVYDQDGAEVSEQANVSTRGLVETGENVLIGGIIVGGSAGTASTMVLRAIGPSLIDLGVENALLDPTIELHDAFGGLLATNDNWKDAQQSDLEASGLAPDDDREAALEVALGPGRYTAIVRGAGDTSGVALVEAYNLEAGGTPAAGPASLTTLR